MAFMGMNMAGGANVQGLFQMGQQAAPEAPSPERWKCTCGYMASGKFCAECGAKRPELQSGWTCPSCGKTENTGKFCMECGAAKPAAENIWVCPACGKQNTGKFCAEGGAKKPAGVPQYQCDKCGWKPEDPAHPPKFCPECGDPFDDGDLQ